MMNSKAPEDSLKKTVGNLSNVFELVNKCKSELDECKTVLDRRIEKEQTA